MNDEERLLIAFLADRDVLCPVCGYNLRSNHSAKCPECGVPLNLRVGSIHLRLSPWIAALVSLCLPLGLISNLTAVAIVHLVRSGSFPGPGRVSAVVGLMITAPLAASVWFLIRKRRRFFRWQPRRQRNFAIGTLLIGLLAAAGFLSLLADEIF